jgi:hypothetical protein
VGGADQEWERARAGGGRLRGGAGGGGGGGGRGGARAWRRWRRRERALVVWRVARVVSSRRRQRASLHSAAGSLANSHVAPNFMGRGRATGRSLFGFESCKRFTQVLECTSTRLDGPCRWGLYIGTIFWPIFISSVGQMVCSNLGTYFRSHSRQQRQVTDTTTPIKENIFSLI